MLTLNGYKVSKATVPVETLRKTLTVKPNVPKVFVSNPNAVPRYRVYKEVEDALYLPKHYGIAEYGVPRTRPVMWSVLKQLIGRFAEAYDLPRTLSSIASSFLLRMMASLVSILEAARRYVLSTLRASFVFLLSSLSTTHFFAISGKSESACSSPMLESGASREISVR
jgi:hypothetical protein